MEIFNRIVFTLIMIPIYIGYLLVFGLWTLIFYNVQSKYSIGANRGKFGGTHDHRL